ncbi:MAG: mannose-1-phosphate guanylyltransferase [Anaerolineae bacterium]
MDNLYALIMAGGGGTRLWPRSRQGQPKQFLNIGTAHSLLREAFLRIQPIIPAQRVLVITGQKWLEAVTAELPEIPLDNILGEPEGRGTAPAIGLAAEVIARRDPNAILACLTADHLIRNQEHFREILLAAATSAHSGRIILLGITPQEPNTGYGYIEADTSHINGGLTLRVKSFKEKPTPAVAEQFLAAGNYYWNSGMFVWSVATIREAMGRFIPDTASRLARIADAWGTRTQDYVLEDVWPAIKNETIDYAIIEKAGDVCVIPADIGWSDVGSWAAVFDVLPSDSWDNVIEGEYVGVDSRNNLIYSPNKLVAVVGVEDMVIVDADDVLLILPRSRAQDVKKIVDELRYQKRTEYL